MPSCGAKLAAGHSMGISDQQSRMASAGNSDAPRARTARGVSEVGYRLLFNEMISGCNVHEIITDAAGEPIDYRFLDINPASERMLGLSAEEVRGRTVRELFPDIEETWIQMFGHVALTRTPCSFEQYSATLGHWFRGVVFSPAERQFAVIYRDVSDERRTADSLQHSKDLLSEAQRIARLGSWEFDPSCDAFVCSDEALRILGLDPNESFVSLSEFLDCLTEPDRARAREAIGQAARVGRVTEVILRVEGGGELRHVLQIAHADSDAGPRAERRVVGIIQDITARVVAEQALQESESRYAMVMRATNDGLWDWSPRSGDMIYNDRWFEMLGYLPGELPETQTTWEALIHPDDRDRVHRVVTRHSANGMPFSLEYRIRHKDGAWRWVVSRGQCVAWAPDGTPARLLGTQRDISKRKQAELELKEKTRQLDHAQRVARIGHWVHDLERGTTSWSDELRRIMGLTTSSDDVGHQTLLALAAPESRDQLERALDHLTASGSSFDFEHKVLLLDGTERFVRHTGTPTIDAHRQVVRTFGTVQDITETHELEARLLQSQKMEAVGRLAGGIAHDFNNMLHVMLGYGELLDMDIPPDGAARESLQEILKAAERAARLVQQLLIFSRHEEQRREPLDVNALITELMRMIGRVIGEHIEAHFTAGADLPLVLGDVGQIEQVLMNLCLNAYDAMPRGGRLDIETSRAPGGLVSTAGAAADAVAIHVRDTGSGIPLRERDRIFEPFFTTKDVGKGTGLGLATAYAIIQRHGGTIQVESEEEVGTRFLILLPCAEGTVASGAVPVPSIDPAGGDETILLAEDDDIVRRLAEQTLTAHGYHVLSAADGRQAVERFEEFATEIDLLILDVLMPRLNGRQVYEAIAARRPSIPVLFCSGYSSDHLQLDHLQNVAGTLIEKPYSQAQLLDRVRAQLDAREA